MFIDNSLSTGIWTSTSAAGSGQRSSSSSGAASGRSAATDTAIISQQARDLYHNSKQIKPMEAVGEMQPLANGYLVDSTKAATNTGLRKYTNIGLGDGSTNLTAMNFSRKQIASRIEQALKTAGIELKEDEKLAISVDSKNQIVVGGIKDKAKAQKIQEALNKDKNLSREMRNHVAAGKINENDAKREQYVKQMFELGQPIPEDVDELFTSPDLRNYIINDYLMENAGLGLSDLSLSVGEDGSTSIFGGDERLAALLSDDEQLGATIGKILQSGNTSSELKVSFEYANGAISDSHSKKMAESKIKGISEKLYKLSENPEELGVADRFREMLERNGGADNKVFEEALAKGFSIHVKSSGKFELVGLEDLDPKLRDTLENLVQQALDEWAAEDGTAMDAGGKRAANFADVYTTYIEEHKFEHGDTDEYPHALEINFATGGTTRVVSPEADKAQREKNQQIASELGQALRGNMEESGIDVSSLEMEVDENGRITVLGDKNDPNVMKAREFIDQFIKEAKAGGKSADEEEDWEAKRDAERGRREIHQGVEGEDTPSNVVASAKGGGRSSSVEGDEVDVSGMSKGELRGMAIAKSWERIFPANAVGGNYYLGLSDRVSDVGRAVYTDDGGGDAASLYRRLRNGMNNFHDKPNRLTYAM